MIKIIEKAVDGGLDKDGAMMMLYIYESRNESEELKGIWDSAFNLLIFSHDFLKAYFKGDASEVPCGMWDHNVEYWQYQGMELIVADNREEYLKGFLNDKKTN